MTKEPNIATSIFPGMNDKRGIMICGYEWGDSKKDQRLSAESGAPPIHHKDAIVTFSNKTPAHGDRALAWPYDRRIHRWFDLWGFPLNREGLGGCFEKCIVQTNWCNTEGHNIKGNVYEKLSDTEQVENFIFHVSKFEPALVLFMGSAMIDVLQNPSVHDRFSSIAGEERTPLRKVKKDFSGRRFWIGFQEFNRCNVVSLPHPSGSRGLSDSYIGLFRNEIGTLISAVRGEKCVDLPSILI